MKARYLFSLIQAILFIFSCGDPADFKSNCIAAAKIINEANNRLQVTKTEDEIKDGKIVATRIYTNNEKSKEYLKVKMKDLEKNYAVIKNQYLNNGKDSFDALCAMAVLNQFKIYLDGEAIDESCKYTKLVVKQKLKSTPSDWFLNKFFYFISRPQGYDDLKWNKMDSNEKFEDVIESLLVPVANGKTCMDNEA